MSKKNLFFSVIVVISLMSGLSAADVPAAEHISVLIDKLESGKVFYSSLDKTTGKYVYTTCSVYLYHTESKKLYTPKGIVSARRYSMGGVRYVPVTIHKDKYNLLLDDGGGRAFKPQSIEMRTVHPAISLLALPRVDVLSWRYPDLSRVVVMKMG